jgi:uncharacterized protein with HEPN domain
MSMDPTIAIRDCLAEIEILHQIAVRTTLETFRVDPIARRAAAYAIQTVSEAVRRLPDDCGVPHRAVAADQEHRQPHAS